MNAKQYKMIIVILLAVMALMLVNPVSGRDDTSVYLLTLEKRIAYLESCTKNVCSIETAKQEEFTLPKDNTELSVNLVNTVNSTEIVITSLPTEKIITTTPEPPDPTEIVIITTPEPDCTLGQPGNIKCVGRAGESPNNKPGWNYPPGIRGRSD